MSSSERLPNDRIVPEEPVVASLLNLDIGNAGVPVSSSICSATEKVHEDTMLSITESGIDIDLDLTLGKC